MATSTSTDRPHPIRKQATWVIIVAALATVLGQWGVDAEVIGRITATIGQLVLILVALGYMVTSSEDDVTPLADPRNEEGESLFPHPEHGGEEEYDLNEDPAYSLDVDDPENQ